MVIHYSTNGQDSACGRSSATLNSSASAEQVSCKTCQRSLGKQEQPAVAVKKATPSLADLRKPKPAPAPARPAATGFSVAAAWQQRLSELGGGSRLPRGKARQRFV
ncbi:hypothetical protein [Pseudomonas sp. NPDC007930]|uniref:hypothetical protein n=1 Tax=Pseudomonas sp. NPDC007930 TaxID=3364417 RepID=UPI0036E6CD42